MNQHPTVELVNVAIKQISEMVDGNTTIGNPITMANGSVILPISKVSVGFASGGSDIPTKVVSEKFGGGSGAGVSVVPVGFLVCTNDDVKLLQLADTSNSVDRLLSMMPELLDKLNGIINKTKDKDKNDKEELNG